MSGEEGDEKPRSDNLEKRPTGNPGDMPQMRDQDVPNNESLKR
jgi:hypothetical protein